MHRTLTTRHPVTPDIEHRVSLHQPVKSEAGVPGLTPAGEPWVVIETFHRQDNGDWRMIGSMREGAFDEIVSDIRDLSAFLTKQSAKREQNVAMEGVAEAIEQQLDEGLPLDDPAPDPAPRLRGRRRVITAEDQ